MAKYIPRHKVGTHCHTRSQALRTRVNNTAHILQHENIHQNIWQNIYQNIWQNIYQGLGLQSQAFEYGFE